jgi:membrane-bound serine protease (ClpP class)
MTVILLLFIAGIMLLAADIFLTSFILAGFGGAAMIAGCVLVYRAFGILSAGLAGVGVAALLGVAIYIEIFLLPKTRVGKGLVVESTSGSSTQPPIAPGAVVGKSATADTTLAPSGYVLVDGRRYEAFCRSGHADRGDLLSVIGVDNFRLIVTKP